MSGLKSFINKHIVDLGNEVPASGSPPVSIPVQQQSGTAYASAPMPSSFADQAMVEDIRKIIGRRGGAFSTLQDKITILSGTGMDVNMATRAAFSLLKAEGKTADGVLSAIDLHVRDVEEEKKNFAGAAANSITVKAGTLRQDAENFLRANAVDEQTIGQLDQQIQQLRARIAERAASAASKQVEAATAEGEIRQKMDKFDTAADAVIQTLASQKVTLASLLS